MKRVAGDHLWRRVSRTRPSWCARIFAMSAGRATTATICSLIAGFGWTSLPWLRFLAQPTLVMAGTDDPIVPVVNGRILARLIPHARLVTINDGHLFLVTRPNEFAHIIADFLS